MLQNLHTHLDAVGLEVDPLISNATCLVARDKPGARVAARSRVTVLATAPCPSSCEVHVEVRSAELMLKQGTRCEQIASALRASLPPKA